MNAPRLYCPNLSVGSVLLDEAEARHALLSLRLRAGEPVVLFDGRGGYAHAVVPDEDGDGVGALRGADFRRSGGQSGAGTKKQRRARRGAAFSVAALETAPPPERGLVLVTAACKGARLDWLVEKATELGVTELVFAEFARSIVQLGAQHLEGLRRTAIEACKQSRRLWLPELSAGEPLAAAVARVVAGPKGAMRPLLVAHPAGDAPVLGSWLAEQEGRPGEVVVVVGPEGGLTDSELHWLQSVGGTGVRLGANILRSETAVLCAAAVWGASAG